MGVEMPEVPAGGGKHPIPIVAIAANDLAASAAFYSKLFAWKIVPFSSELTTAVTPAGPSVSLLSNVPEGFQGTVPFIGVPDVSAALDRVAAAGGSIERAAWDVPPVGRFARFKDTSGTIYGFTDAVPPGGLPRLRVPFGSNPKPPAGAICSLEMHASDGAAAARFFGGLFDWGTMEMMPEYMGFDPGAGVAGVFQSHTPAIPALAYLYVADVGAKLAEIDAAGGKRTADPMPLPGVATFGYFTDPSGTNMGLLGP
ncbi:MAG: VOC family protein [Candidatus Eisenbacteria bacterium]